jgi:hypothetical protein
MRNETEDQAEDSSVVDGDPYYSPRDKLEYRQARRTVENLLDI